MPDLDRDGHPVQQQHHGVRTVHVAVLGAPASYTEDRGWRWSRAAGRVGQSARVRSRTMRSSRPRSPAGRRAHVLRVGLAPGSRGDRLQDVARAAVEPFSLPRVQGFVIFPRPSWTCSAAFTGTRRYPGRIPGRRSAGRAGRQVGRRCAAAPECRGTASSAAQSQDARFDPAHRPDPRRVGLGWRR
jgi:hypothetical protein